MKKVILGIILITIHSNLKAQTYTPVIDTCSYLQQFTGEWKYVNGTDTIKVYLRYHRYHSTFFGPNDYFDRLWGWYEYKQGNTVVMSNYQNRFTTLPQVVTESYTNSHSIIMSMPDCADTTRKLIGQMDDLNHPTSTYRIVAELNPTKTQMVFWHTFTMGNFHNPDIEKTLPQEFILIKQ